MKKSFADGIALGTFLMLLAFFILALAFDLRLFGEERSSYLQTVFTALAAISAAYIALHGIRQQILQNFEIETERRNANLLAAKAILPLALSDLVEKSGKILKYLIDGGAPNPKNLITELTDSNTIDTLSKCIQFSSSQSAGRLSQIIRYSQLVRARFDGDHFSSPYPEHKLDWDKVDHRKTSYIIDFAILISLCNSAFSFSRGGELNIPRILVHGDVNNSLMTAGIFLDCFPRLSQVTQERANTGRLERDFTQPKP